MTLISTPSPLPSLPHEMKAIKPVFDTVCYESLLQKCAHVGTQNTMESFDHLVWKRNPKTTFCGRGRIGLAVADAIVVFNSRELTGTDFYFLILEWKLDIMLPSALKNCTVLGFTGPDNKGLRQRDNSRGSVHWTMLDSVWILREMICLGPTNRK